MDQNAPHIPHSSNDTSTARIVPLTHLPLDLISKIFLIVCEPPRRGVYGNITYFSPLKLGRLCREWRELAWGIPLLWAYVPISLSSQPPNDGRAQEEVVETRKELLIEWLDRSAPSSSPGCPLHIVIRDNVAFFLPLLDVLVQHSMRWESLEMHPYPDEVIGERCFGRIPNLKRLSLLGAKGTSVHCPLLDRTMAGSLEELNLTCVSVGPGPQANLSSESNLIVMNRLRKLTIYGLRSVRFFNLLKYTDGGDLEVLTVHEISPGMDVQEDSLAVQLESSQINQGVISLLKLHTLNIHDPQLPNLSSFLDRLHCPNLERLVVMFTNSNTPPPYGWLHSIDQFLLRISDERGRTKLRLLVLEIPQPRVVDGTGQGQRELLKLLKHGGLRNLTRLTLYERAHTDFILPCLVELLGTQGGRVIYLPELKRLEVLSPDSLENLIVPLKERWQIGSDDLDHAGTGEDRRRFGEVAKLSTVRLRFGARKEIMKVFEKEIQEGMQFRFGFGFDD